MPPYGKKFMRSTFTLGREYPQAIGLRDEALILGPFCVHCGAPREHHSRRGEHCPRSVGPLFPLPCCKCHGVRPPSPVRV